MTYTLRKKAASFIIIVISDITVILISFLLSYYVRSGILTALFSKFREDPIHPFSDLLQHFYFICVWVFIFAYEKLYTKRFTFWQEVKVLIKSATLSSSLIMIMIFVTRKQIQFSRTIIILAWLLSLFLFPLSRHFTKHLLIKINLWKKRLIIIGVHRTSLLALKSIKTNKTMGYQVLGFLDDDPAKIGKKYFGIKVLGTVSELENITKTYKSKDIMIASPHISRNQLKKLFLRCEDISESLWWIPRSGDLITEGVEIEVLGQVLTLLIKKNLAKPWNILIKLIFEKILTLFMAILLLPILALIAIAIKLDSKGPMIFVQKRLGQGKKMFNLHKFRSMYLDGDARLSEYLSNNQKARLEWEKFRKIKNYDPRVTRVGRIIRKFSLDELPQLFDVLTGKMSLVGPRPYLLEELESNDSFVNLIARIKPGITGLWQVSGRNELPFEERIAIDEYYIRNWSLWMDITIIFKSIKILLSQQGAY